MNDQTMTDRKLIAERELQESEEKFRNLVEYISDVIYEIDSQGVIIYISPIIFEKQAAVGRLAAAVAHEILNPASIISSRLQFLEEENLAEPARENLRVSREQLQRIVKISRDLLQLSVNHPVHLISKGYQLVLR